MTSFDNGGMFLVQQKTCHPNLCVQLISICRRPLKLQIEDDADLTGPRLSCCIGEYYTVLPVSYTVLSCCIGLLHLLAGVLHHLIVSQWCLICVLHFPIHVLHCHICDMHYMWIVLHVSHTCVYIISSHYINNLTTIESSVVYMNTNSLCDIIDDRNKLTKNTQWNCIIQCTPTFKKTPWCQ